MKTLIIALMLYAPNIRAEDWGLLMQYGRSMQPQEQQYPVQQQQVPTYNYYQGYQEQLQQIQKITPPCQKEYYRDAWGKIRERCS